MDTPTEKQLDAIRKLARATKSSINLNKITSKQDASRVIDALIERLNRTRNNNANNELRDKKVAYGLATKLIFRKYQQLNLEFGDDFWKEVDEFYREYQKHQDRALGLGSQR